MKIENGVGPAPSLRTSQSQQRVLFHLSVRSEKTSVVISENIVCEGSSDLLKENKTIVQDHNINKDSHCCFFEFNNLLAMIIGS